MKKWLALFLVAVLVFSMVGCKGKEEEKELTTVTVGLPGSLEVLGYANWLCAVYNGYFEEEGLKVVMKPEAGTDVCKMLETGEVDFAAPSPALIFTAALSGIDMKVVYQHDCNNIFGFAVREDSGIDSWDDLNGTSIVTDASWYFLSNPILEAAGVDVDSIEFVSAAAERSVLLGAGTCDAAFTWQKEWQLWEATGIDIKYLDGEEIVKNTSNGLCVMNDYYENEENKWIIEALGRALAKGTYFCEVNPEAATEIVTHRWPTLGVAVEDAQPSIEALAVVATPDSGNYGESQRDRWQTTLDWLDYYEIVDASQIDLDSILKSGEYVDAYNDWDRDALKEEILKFDISKVENWTED